MLSPVTNAVLDPAVPNREDVNRSARCTSHQALSPTGRSSGLGLSSIAFPPENRQWHLIDKTKIPYSGASASDLHRLPDAQGFRQQNSVR
jgi:hypothetical protein